jgi:hypothetical protein
MLANRFKLCPETPLANELDAELEHILSWDDFNVNRISQLSNRQPLLLVGLSALNHFGLVGNVTLGISVQCAINFIKAVEHHYMCESSCLPGVFLVPLCMSQLRLFLWLGVASVLFIPQIFDIS